MVKSTNAKMNTADLIFMDKYGLTLCLKIMDNGPEYGLMKC